MVVERITPRDFPKHYKYGRTSEEITAVRDLYKVNEGVKFPCRWSHDKRQVCTANVSFRKVAKDKGFKIKYSCRDKTVYILRVGAASKNVMDTTYGW